MILRHAVALAMSGQEDELGKLRARYASAFMRTPSAAAFSLLTGPVDEMTSAGIASAMAAIPSVSVAGEYDDMMDRPRQSDDSTLPAAKLAMSAAQEGGSTTNPKASEQQAKAEKHEAKASAPADDHK